jgi:hypothetical protein
MDSMAYHDFLSEHTTPTVSSLSTVIAALEGIPVAIVQLVSAAVSLEA